MSDYQVMEHPAGGWDVRAASEQEYREHFVDRSSAIDAARRRVAPGGGVVRVIDGNGEVDEIVVEPSFDAASDSAA